MALLPTMPGPPLAVDSMPELGASGSAWDHSERPDHGPRLRTASIQLEKRSQSFGVGLSRYVSALDPVATFVCHRHPEDRYVASRALELLKADEIPIDELSDSARLAHVVADIRPKLLIACQHGVEIWQMASVPVRVVGDGAEVIWWRSLEARGAALLRKEARNAESAHRAELVHSRRSDTEEDR